MNRNDAIEGYNLECRIKGHERHIDKLKRDRNFIANSSDRSKILYDINKTDYPGDTALKVIDIMVEYHENQAEKLIKELSAL